MNGRPKPESRKKIEPGPWSHAKASHLPRPGQTFWCGQGVVIASLTRRGHDRECQPRHERRRRGPVDRCGHWFLRHRHELWRPGSHRAPPSSPSRFDVPVLWWEQAARPGIPPSHSQPAAEIQNRRWQSSPSLTAPCWMDDTKALAERNYSSLLDRSGFLKPYTSSLDVIISWRMPDLNVAWNESQENVIIGVNASKQILSESHVIKILINLITWGENFLLICVWTAEGNSNEERDDKNDVEWSQEKVKMKHSSFILASYWPTSNCDPCGARPAMSAMQRR